MQLTNQMEADDAVGRFQRESPEFYDVTELFVVNRNKTKFPIFRGKQRDFPLDGLDFLIKLWRHQGSKFPFSGEFPVFMTQSAISNLSQSLSFYPASSNKLSSSPDNTVPSNAPSNPSPVVAMQNDMKLVMQKISESCQ